MLFASLFLIFGCGIFACFGNRIDRQFPLGTIGKSVTIRRFYVMFCFCLVSEILASYFVYSCVVFAVVC